VTIDEIIERLEKASGPDRELDAAIAIEIGAYPTDWQARLPGYSLEYFMAWSGFADNYTSSIDAALTLVAADAVWSIGRRIKVDGYVAIIDGLWGRPQPMTPRSYHSHLGATPALALCIAALRARKASQP
jgi:hypothetical protein